MISPDMIMYTFGMFLILVTFYIIYILIIRKSVWTYPFIISAYIFLAIISLFHAIIFIKRIEITNTIYILMFVLTIIWGLITIRLPARKEKMIKEHY